MSIKQKWDYNLPMEINANCSWSHLLDERWNIEKCCEERKNSTKSTGLFSLFSARKPKGLSLEVSEDKNQEEETKNEDGGPWTASSMFSIFKKQPVANPSRILKLDAFYFRGFMTEGECQCVIREAENLGFGRTHYPKHYRGNLRLMVTDQDLADKLWERLKPHVSSLLPDPEQRSGSWKAVGLNEKFRLSKYFPGDEFGSHCDASFKRSSTEKSMYTVNIYLNGGFKDGRTRFYKGKPGSKMIYAAVPEPGAALVFRQPPGQHYLHDGERLGSDLKYLLRTDVMYELI